MKREPQKRTREEGEEIEPEASPWKQQNRNRFSAEEQKFTEDEEKHRIEALYADLPSLPPKLPQPDYMIQE